MSALKTAPLNPMMEVLCPDTASLSHASMIDPSKFLTKRVATNREISDNGDQDVLSRRYSAIEPYQTLASKKPKPSKSAQRSSKRKTTGELRRGSVLVVDDVPDVTEMIELLLKHAGYEVSTADSAKDALRLARNRHYDLIISDIGMPDMNGYELATELRKLINYDRTPMIAVTGYSEYDDRGRAVNAGFDFHLTKPIEPSQLLDLMHRLLTQSESGTNH